jgi:hypothetical protein
MCQLHFAAHVQERSMQSSYSWNDPVHVFLAARGPLFFPCCRRNPVMHITAEIFMTITDIGAALSSALHMMWHHPTRLEPAYFAYSRQPTTCSCKTMSNSCQLGGPPQCCATNLNPAQFGPGPQATVMVTVCTQPSFTRVMLCSSIIIAVHSVDQLPRIMKMLINPKTLIERLNVGHPAPTLAQNRTPKWPVRLINHGISFSGPEPTSSMAGLDSVVSSTAGLVPSRLAVAAAQRLPFSSAWQVANEAHNTKLVQCLAHGLTAICGHQTPYHGHLP